MSQIEDLEVVLRSLGEQVRLWRRIRKRKEVMLDRLKFNER